MKIWFHPPAPYGPAEVLRCHYHHSRTATLNLTSNGMCLPVSISTHPVPKVSSRSPRPARDVHPVTRVPAPRSALRPSPSSSRFPHRPCNVYPTVSTGRKPNSFSRSALLGTAVSRTPSLSYPPFSSLVEKRNGIQYSRRMVTLQFSHILNGHRTISVSYPDQRSAFAHLRTASLHYPNSDRFAPSLLALLPPFGPPPLNAFARTSLWPPPSTDSLLCLFIACSGLARFGPVNVARQRVLYVYVRKYDSC